MFRNNPGTINGKSTIKRYFIFGIALIALLGLGSAFSSAPGSENPQPEDGIHASETGIHGLEHDIVPTQLLSPSKPTQIIIPKLGINALVSELGLNGDQSLQIPRQAMEVGWYKDGPTPGEAGTALMVGHLDWTSGPAVFYHLDQLAEGDLVKIKRQDGTVAVFEVREKQAYPQSTDFPWEEIYLTSGSSGLRLITCIGEFSRSAQRYSHNLVVFADLVRAE